MKDEPTLQDWKALYEAAVEFKNSKCWDWMVDSDVFGVRGPYTGEIYYCCVMGMLGEHYGLAAYKGSVGLGFMYGINEIIEAGEDPLFHQACLSVSFENREELSPPDLKLIKELELKFRGKNQWPLFRDYTPGYFPWYLDREQCLELTHILREALGIALRFQENEAMLENESEPDCYLVRVPRSEGDGFVWEDRWLEPEEPGIGYVSFTINDDLLGKRIKAAKPRRPEAWEVDVFYAPAPVQDRDKGRPYFPRMCLCLDPAMGTVIFMHMVESLEEKGYEFLESFIQGVESHGALPKKLLICNDETGVLFEDLAEKLGVKLEMREVLETIEDFRADLGAFFDMR